MPESNHGNYLIARLDFGESPDGVLVVREARWQRVFGALAGLAFGIPLSWLAAYLMVQVNAPVEALMLAAVATLGLLGGVWLFYQVLCADYYYAALDSEYLYLRRGPRRLEQYRLSELSDFSVAWGTVVTQHTRTRRRLQIIKNAYAKDNVFTLARRLNSWRQAPPETRAALVQRLETIELQELRLFAHRQLTRGLCWLGVYPLLLILSLHFKFFQAPAISLLVWLVYSCGAILMIAAGVVRWFAFLKRKRLSVG